MMFLSDLDKALNARGLRTYREGGKEPFLNVWANPADRYPTHTIYWDYSQSAGGVFIWGDRYQYSAPWTGVANIGLVADQVEKTLRP